MKTQNTQNTHNETRQGDVQNQSVGGHQRRPDPTLSKAKSKSPEDDPTRENKVQTYGHPDEDRGLNVGPGVDSANTERQTR